MSHCDFCKNVMSEVLSHHPEHCPPSFCQTPRQHRAIAEQHQLGNMSERLSLTDETKSVSYKSTVCCFTCTEITITWSQRDHVWRSFLSSPLVLSCLTTAVVGFCLIVAAGIWSNFSFEAVLRRFWHPTSQDYILSSIWNLAESALVWMGRLLCFAASAVTLALPSYLWLA